MYILHTYVIYTDRVKINWQNLASTVQLISNGPFTRDFFLSHGCVLSA